MDSETVLREVDGFPGYFVTGDGDVFTNRSRNGKGVRAAPLRPVAKSLCSANRYLQFAADGKKLLVHGAVARAFIGKPPEGMEVSHRDGNSFNNVAANLEYLTHRENEAMKVIHGTSARGSRNPMAKLSQAAADEIRLRLSTSPRGSATKLAKEFGVCMATISLIKSGRRWSAERV